MRTQNLIFVCGRLNSSHFAGVTTRYFGRKEEREALGKRDQVLEKFLEVTWGAPKATMDTPWNGPEAIE